MEDFGISDVKTSGTNAEELRTISEGESSPYFLVFKDVIYRHT